MNALTSSRQDCCWKSNSQCAGYSIRLVSAIPLTNTTFRTQSPMTHSTFILNYVLVAIAFVSTTATAQAEIKRQPDIVFIIVDDLNDVVSSLLKGGSFEFAIASSTFTFTLPLGDLQT